MVRGALGMGAQIEMWGKPSVPKKIFVLNGLFYRTEEYGRDCG